MEYPAQMRSVDCYYNTKTTVYRTGATRTTYCNQAVFKDDSAESIDKRKQERFKHEEQERKTDERLKELHEAGESVQTMTAEEHSAFFRPLGKVIMPKEDTEPRSDSQKRAIDKVFDIVLENDWDLFVTVTFSDEEARGNPEQAIKKLRNWLSHLVQRNGLKYLLIPEYHKNGGIHAHLLTNDVFTLVDSGTKVYKGFKRPMKDETAEARGLMPICGMTVYNLPQWKHGFSTAIRTYGAPEVCAFYMTKYITKDLKKIFGKFYWSSRNIDRNPTKVLSNTDFESVKGDIFHPQHTTLRFKYDFYANIGSDNNEDDRENSLNAVSDT